MRLLFACEFYFPSVGGVQEVMKQLAERMVQRGHQVTVATTRLGERDFTSLNGVEVVGFDIVGNLVRGMHGEIERYREFVRSFPCDALMVKAAQQWTFDALWPVLDEISCRKVFIPCGFSGLYEPTYQEYFRQLPDVMRKWDHLVFYAEQYRDVDFARAHGLDRFTILPNGASEVEFDAQPDPTFRRRHGIPEDSFVLLTVGSMTGVKGHREVAEAFARLKLRGSRHATLLLNGNEPPKPPIAPTPAPSCEPSPPAQVTVDTPPSCSSSEVLTAAGPTVTASSSATAVAVAAPVPGVLTRATRVYRDEGLSGVANRVSLYLQRPLRVVARTARGPMKIVGMSVKIADSMRREGIAATAQKVHRGVYDRTRQRAIWKVLPEHWRPPHVFGLAQWMAVANRSPLRRKLALHTNFARAELVQAYMTADLFIFASNIEYSPLVLYEAAAAGTPFLTVPVGNSAEIARWTGAGVVCPAPKDERGYTRAEPEVLAAAIAELAQDPARLRTLGETGRRRWLANFTWQVIAARYEGILAGTAQPCDTMVLKESP
jgi:glycosyltransferase involved in cell wall biosynthesis